MCSSAKIRDLICSLTSQTAASCGDRKLNKASMHEKQTIFNLAADFSDAPKLLFKLQVQYFSVCFQCGSSVHYDEFSFQLQLSAECYQLFITGIQSSYFSMETKYKLC
jgi:hypothetical protein